jgi:hypothetical protein
MHILLRKPPDFDLVPMLIGVKGTNTKAIFQETGAKLRIRGRGSKYLEVDGVREAPVPLMIAITHEKTCMVEFHRAVELTITVLLSVTERFKNFCKNGCLGNLADEPIFSRGAISRGAEHCIKDLLHHFPRASLRGGATSSRDRATSSQDTRSSLRAEAKAFEPMVKGNQSYFKYDQPFFEYVEPHVDPHAAVELYGAPSAAWQEWPSGQLFFQVKVEGNDQLQSEAPAQDEFAAYMKEAVTKFMSADSDSE